MFRRHRCVGEYPAVEFIILGCSANCMLFVVNPKSVRSFNQFSTAFEGDDDVNKSKNHLSQ